jgi:hypothetical protein
VGGFRKEGYGSRKRSSVLLLGEEHRGSEVGWGLERKVDGHRGDGGVGGVAWIGKY